MQSLAGLRRHFGLVQELLGHRPSFVSQIGRISPEDFVSLEGGELCLQFTVPPRLCDNALPLGVAVTLLDVATSWAIMAQDRALRPGVSVAQSLNLSRCLEPKEEVIFRARPLRVGRVMAFSECDVLDKRGDVLGRGLHTKYLSMGSFWDAAFGKSMYPITRSAIELYCRSFRSSSLPHAPPVDDFSKLIALDEKGVIEVRPEHLNELGGMQGGCVAVLLEQAGLRAAAAASMTPASSLRCKSMHLTYMAVGRGTLSASVKTPSQGVANVALCDGLRRVAECDMEWEERDSANVAQGGGRGVAPGARKDPVGDSEGFNRLELRVGLVLEARALEGSDKLICGLIDVGEGEPRIIVSGLRPHVMPEDLVSRRVLVLCNLKARKLAGQRSNGMLLAANRDSSVALVEAPPGSEPGQRVTHVGADSVAEPGKINLSKSVNPWSKAVPGLHIDEQGRACFQDKPLIVEGSTGFCIGGIRNASIS